MTDAIAAVGEPTRRQLLALLREHEEAMVSDLVAMTGLRQPAVSKHLKVLHEARLVAVRPDGRRRWYRLDAAGLRAIHEWIADFEQVWQDRFDALDALVSEPDPTDHHPEGTHP